MCSKQNRRCKFKYFQYDTTKKKNESKTLAKDISCKRECKFDGSKCNSIGDSEI